MPSVERRPVTIRSSAARSSGRLPAGLDSYHEPHSALVAGQCRALTAARTICVTLTMVQLLRRDAASVSASDHLLPRRGPEVQRFRGSSGPIAMAECACLAEVQDDVSAERDHSPRTGERLMATEQWSVAPTAGRLIRERETGRILQYTAAAPLTVLVKTHNGLVNLRLGTSHLLIPTHAETTALELPASSVPDRQRSDDHGQVVASPPSWLGAPFPVTQSCNVDVLWPSFASIRHPLCICKP